MYSKQDCGQYLLIRLPRPQESCRRTVRHSTKEQGDSTTKKHLGAYERWRQWTMDHHLQDFPPCTHYNALYLQHIAQTSGSKAAVEEAVYALAWVHSIAGIPSTTDNLFIKTTVEGLRRILPRPRRRRNPSLLTYRKQWCKTPWSITLSNVRLTPECLLIFAGFLQFKYNAQYFCFCNNEASKGMP